jgi:hypothetical protein
MSDLLLQSLRFEARIEQLLDSARLWTLSELPAIRGRAVRRLARLHRVRSHAVSRSIRRQAAERRAA